MITKQEVTETVYAIADKGAEDPLLNGYATLTHEELERFAHAIYKLAIDDACKEIDPKWYSHDVAKRIVEGCVEAIRELGEIK